MVSNSLWLYHEGRSAFCFHVFLSDSAMDLWLCWLIKYGRSGTWPAFQMAFEKPGSFCFLSWNTYSQSPEQLRNLTACRTDQVQKPCRKGEYSDYTEKRPCISIIPTETSPPFLPSRDTSPIREPLWISLPAWAPRWLPPSLIACGTEGAPGWALQPQSHKRSVNGYGFKQLSLRVVFHAEKKNIHGSLIYPQIYNYSIHSTSILLDIY